MTDSQQQFCLRWNNFQANITSQFEALRDDEDFVDVTFACDGRRLQAHKVVLSACSPYFKELFKTNPCKHPIIFMRDVEFEHLQSLLEFMYAGEVNISQAELPTFLRTAESLQIRGLTDSQSSQHNNEKHLKTNNINASNGRGLVSPNFDDERSKTPPASSPPPLKRLCKRSDSPQNSSPAPAILCATNTPRSSRPLIEPQVQLDCYKDIDTVEPKVELPEFGSDDESKQDLNTLSTGYLSMDGGMEVLPSYSSSYSASGMDGGLPGPSHCNAELNQEQQARRVRRGRPRLGIKGRQPSTHGNSPSRGDWLPLDMRTTPPGMPATYRGFDESQSADGVITEVPVTSIPNINIPSELTVTQLQYKLVKQEVSINNDVLEKPISSLPYTLSSNEMSMKLKPVLPQSSNPQIMQGLNDINVSRTPVIPMNFRPYFYPSTAIRLDESNVNPETIEAILIDSLEGESIVTEYRRSGSLTPTSQQKLVDILLNRCSRHLLTCKRLNDYFAHLSRAIIQLIPNDNPDVYYIAPFSNGNGKNSRGKLPDKWRNLTHLLRSQGVIPKKKKTLNNAKDHIDNLPISNP